MPAVPQFAEPAGEMSMPPGGEAGVRPAGAVMSLDAATATTGTYAGPSPAAGLTEADVERIVAEHLARRPAGPVPSNDPGSPAEFASSRSLTSFSVQK